MCAIYSMLFCRPHIVKHVQLTLHTSVLTADIVQCTVVFLTRCDVLLFQTQKSCENVQALLTVGSSNVAFRKQNGGMMNSEGNKHQQM